MKQFVITCISLAAFSVSALAQNDAGSPTPANNSGKNERDRSGDTKTADDQSNSSGDIKITAAIRRAVVQDKNLSMTAKNVKIITADGVVTLRGPVKTEHEKMRVAKLARMHSGDAKVVDQLEVEHSK